MQVVVAAYVVHARRYSDATAIDKNGNYEAPHSM